MDSAGLGDGNDTVSPQWRRGCVCKEMTNSDLTATGRAERLSHIARAWWPVPAIIAATLTAQQLLLTSQHDVGGHAAEHLAGASAPFMAAALLSIMFWATPRAPRQVDLLVVSCVWFATTLLVMLGNLRVVDDQRGSPTYSDDLARAILALVEAGGTGTYHVANAGVATWWELARAAIDAWIAALPAA